MEKQKITIERRTAKAIEVPVNSFIKIDQSNGPQLAVIIAFNRNDHEEKISLGNTRISLAYGPYKRESTNNMVPYWVEEGDTILSNKWNPMLFIETDTFKKHDTIFDPCDSYLNTRIMGGAEGMDGCRELHAKALKQWSIGYTAIPNGINLFQNTTYTEKGISVVGTSSKASDNIIFKTHQDLIVSISACPMALSENVDLNIEIF